MIDIQHVAPAMTNFRLWFERFIYILLSALVFVCLLIVATLLWGTYWNTTPVQVYDLESIPKVQYCPGDSFDVKLKIVTKGKVLLYQYISVMTTDLKQNYSGKQTTVTPMPQPVESVFEEVIPWEVPDLPPGDYVRMFALRSNMSSQDPIFHPNPFTIGENCESSDKSSGIWRWPENYPNGNPSLGYNNAILDNHP